MHWSMSDAQTGNVCGSDHGTLLALHAAPPWPSIVNEDLEQLERNPTGC
jgi:hypothetical protein